MKIITSPTLFDFKLTKAEEKKAWILQKKNIIMDMHFGGPIIYDKYLNNTLKKILSKKIPIYQIFNIINQERTKRITSKKLKKYKQWWNMSGVTIGCKTVGIFDKSNYFFTFNKAIRDIKLISLEIESFNWLKKITKYKEVLNVKKKNRHGFILRLENTTQIGSDLKKIDLFYNLGVRIIQLTYNTKNCVGCGCMSREDFGITNFGRKLIKYLNKRKILIDISHCGPKTTLDTVRYSKFPVVATHTFCKKLYPHLRGKTDKELKMLAKKGGLIGISINPAFFTSHQFTLNDFLDHIDHTVKVAGIEHVGIGTDWDTPLPPLLKKYFSELKIYNKYYDWRKEIKGYMDCRDWINIIRGLIKRGYRNEEIQKIIGGNFLRVFKQVVG